MAHRFPRWRWTTCCSRIASASDSSKTLGRLVNMQFVRGEAGRFYLHQVDRDYALSRLGEGEPADREVEPPPLTCYALRHRAAEYFKETRKPREAWKTLNDLAPQLAEFDLRLVGGDHNAAASVLFEIDFDYLSLWGHYRLVSDRYEKLQGRLTDRDQELASTRALGNSYRVTGSFEKALHCYEDALALARAQNRKDEEASSLGSLASHYSDTGNSAKAIESIISLRWHRLKISAIKQASVPSVATWRTH